jgi:hypothetical protein
VGDPESRTVGGVGKAGVCVCVCVCVCVKMWLLFPVWAGKTLMVTTFGSGKPSDAGLDLNKYMASSQSSD